MMRILALGPLLLLAAALTSNPRAASGQEKPPQQAAASVPVLTASRRTPFTLEFDHVTGTFALYNHRHQLIAQNSSLGSAVPAEVPPDRALEVVIVNANSLLYQYNVSTRPLGGRRVRACRDVGSQFAGSGFAIGVSAVATGGALPAFTTVVKEWPDVPVLKGGASFGPVSAAELSDATRRTQAASDRFAAFAESVAQLSTALGDSLSFIAELAESTPIDTLLQRLRRNIAQINPDLAVGALVPRAILAEYQKVAAPAGELAGLVAAIPVVGNSSVEFPGVQPAQQTLRRVGEVLARARSAGHALQRALARIEIAHALSRRTFLLEPSTVAREITLQLSPVAASDSLVRLKQGSVLAYTTPVTSLLCSIEAGFTIMSPSPDYIIDKTSNVVLDRSQGSSLRSSVALMLDVSPAAFGILGVVGGLGLSSNGGAPDLYVGGSMRAFAPFHITVGSVWQRQQQLPANVRLGEAAPSAGALSSLAKRYKSGVFVGVMLAR